MKINIDFDIDIKAERRRIDKAFTNHKDKDVQKKLHEFMDFVEKQDWSGALKNLKQAWWRGYDKKDECSRLEYIGCVKTDCPFLSRHESYINFVLNMCYYKELKNENNN